MFPNRILVVTDNPETSRWMSDSLGLYGDVVDTVPDGARAFQRVWEAGYDVIIAELGMRGVDGRDLYMALQNTWPELTRHMIFLAAEPDSAQERFVVRTGAILLRGTLNLPDLRDAISAVRTDRALVRAVSAIA